MLITRRQKTDRITTLVVEQVVKQIGLDGLQGATCRGSCMIWQSCNHAQHINIFCWRIAFIPLPRTRGRAKTRAARDFWKTIVAYTRVGDRRCYDSRAWNVGAFIQFLFEFSSLTCLTVSRSSFGYTFRICSSRTEISAYDSPRFMVYQRYTCLFWTWVSILSISGPSPICFRTHSAV